MSSEDLEILAYYQLLREKGRKPSIRAVDRRARRIYKAQLKECKALRKDSKRCPPIHFVSGVKNFFKLLGQPECILRPVRFGSYYVKRIFNRFHHVEEVALPWGCTLNVRPTEYIGRRLVMSGIFDLCVSEVLWRLLGPGHHAADVGANMGYMSSIMAARVGNDGLVTAFEPHPELYLELSKNMLPFPQISLQNYAASDKSGEMTLEIPKQFDGNCGVSTLAVTTERSDRSDYCRVQAHRLDDVLSDDKPIQLLKIDVEGHELEVLQGCSGLLKDRRIANIIFEDLAESDCASYLKEAGYDLFYIGKTFSGLAIGPIDKKAQQYRCEQPEGASYLATADTNHTLSQLSGKGWNIMNINRSAFRTSAERRRIEQEHLRPSPIPSERQDKWSRDRTPPRWGRKPETGQSKRQLSPTDRRKKL